MRLKRFVPSPSITQTTSELDYAPSPDEEGYIVIDPQSLQNAISVHYSDVKVVAVRNIPPIKLPVEE